MSEIKLDERLMTVASMVRKSGAVADIGTDHAYLPAYLIKNGICSRAYACDVKEMPLKNAEKTIKNENLCDKISTVLSNGLEALEENCAETIVIAGMGGILIKDILSACPWIKNGSVDLVLQPMTHAEIVREFLCENGFEILKENGCFFNKHSYCVILASYTEKKVKIEKGFYYYGKLTEDSTEKSKLYIKKQYDRLKKKYNALLSKKHFNEECSKLFEILEDFKNNTEVFDVTVKDVSNYIDSIAPYNTKCDWDNCGIIIGNENAEVTRMGFCLDLTEETLNQAVRKKISLMITHHPVIFHAQKSFTDKDLVYKAALKGISIISAHTCFDCADGGVNDALCDILNLSDVKKVESDECAVPMARIGSLQNETTSKELARFVSQKLNTTVRLVSSTDEIKEVAVCGGAGMSFLNDVISAGADAYITGDISHHEMLEAKEKGICIVAAGHFETEYPAMSYLMKYIQKEFPEIDCMLLKQSNPVEFIGN